MRSLSFRNLSTNNSEPPFDCATSRPSESIKKKKKKKKKEKRKNRGEIKQAGGINFSLISDIGCTRPWNRHEVWPEISSLAGQTTGSSSAIRRAQRAANAGTISNL